MKKIPTIDSIKKLAARFKYLEAADAALELISNAKSVGDERLIVTVQTLASEYLARTNDLQSSLAILFEAHELAREKGFTDLTFNILRNLGAAFLECNRPLDALEYLERARNHLEKHPELFEERDRLLSLWSVLHNIGQSYVEVDDLHRAKELYKESIDIATRCGDPSAIGTSCVNFAICCTKMRNFSEANMYLEIAKENFLQIEHFPNLAATNIIFSEVKVALGEEADAVPMLKSAIEYFRSIHDLKREIAAIRALVRIHIEFDSTRDFEIAEYYLRYAIECAKSARLAFELTSLYRQMCEYLKVKGDLQGSYKYGELYVKQQETFETSVIQGGTAMQDSSDSFEKIIRRSYTEQAIHKELNFPFILTVRDVKLIRAVYSSIKNAVESADNERLLKQSMQTLRGYTPQIKQFLRNASKAKV